MISMKYAKFMFKFNNQMLPNSFNNHFIKLENVHSYNKRQKIRNEYFQCFILSEVGRKTLHHICFNIWSDIPPNYRYCFFFKI